MNRLSSFCWVDSWALVSRGGAVVELAAVALWAGRGCVRIGRSRQQVAVLSDAEDAAGAASELAAGWGVVSAEEAAVPGVTVSTVAVLPTAAFGPVMPTAGVGPRVSVSSPDSLAGVNVGGPLRAAMVTSGPLFRIPVERRITARTLARGFRLGLCIRATASGSG